jgi:hypothetical protein
MGHMRLGLLPRTHRWQEIVDLIGDGASSASVAAATLDAVDEEFAEAASDPTLRRTFWLLTQLPDAARKDNFGEALRALGFVVSDEPSAAELAATFTDAIDRYASSEKARSGIGELAQMAAIETLAGLLHDRTASLLGTTPADVKREVGRIATEHQFGELARTFFARFIERFLTYYVSRELPRHVGEGRRFTNLESEKKFAAALKVHCRQAAKIIESFAGSWYSKARFEQDLSEERAGRFLGYALKKIRGELQRGAA